MDKDPEVIGAEALAEGRFLSLKILSWRDAHGVERRWESAERVSFSGAVLIVPRLMPSRRLLLIKQYRPPARRYVIEFPAGLINPGESPESAAVRELREETGFVADKVVVHPPAYTSPGMTDESVNMVAADIDERKPENMQPVTEFDPSEMIETILVPQDDLPAFYRSESAKGVLFDAKLAGYILGLEG